MNRLRKQNTFLKAGNQPTMVVRNLPPYLPSRHMEWNGNGREQECDPEKK